MSAPLLSVRNLGKTYQGGMVALKNVSFDVQAGEFLIVIGLSGSGKSTLLRCINGLTEPSQGEILVRDRRDRRREFAMIFQHFNLIPRHSVLSNVLMGSLATTPTLRSMLGLFSDEARQRALENLRLVGLTEKGASRADQLSGGQQQRVAIARALCQQPSLLLADEPVASLDPATSHSVMGYLRRVNQELGLTVVCNLHFLSLVREYGTRVIALRQGEIVFRGAPKDIDQSWFKKIYGDEARDIDVE